MLSKRFIRVCCLVLLLTMITGCGKVTTISNTKDTERVTLNKATEEIKEAKIEETTVEITE